MSTSPSRAKYIAYGNNVSNLADIYFDVHMLSPKSAQRDAINALRLLHKNGIDVYKYHDPHFLEKTHRNLLDKIPKFKMSMPISPINERDFAYLENQKPKATQIWKTR